MGLGKTVTALTATKKLNAFPTLVFAPPNVARNVWHNEVKKWKHLKDIKATVVMGAPKKRQGLLEADADVYVISSGLVKWFAQHWNSNDKKFKMLIIDESGQYRAHNSTRSVIMRQIGRYIKRCVLLTASPSPNGVQDLYSQFAILDNGKRLGKTWGDFIEEYFIQNIYNHTVKIKSKEKEDEIIDAISDITFVYKADDYLDMPDLIQTVHPVYLSEKLLTQYRELEKEYLLEFENGDSIDVMNSLVMAGKLQQFANGTVRKKIDVDDDQKISKSEQVIDVHDEKIKQLKEMCHPDIAGSKNLLIAYSHRADRQKIVDAIPGAVVFKGKQEMYDHWNLNRNTGLRYVCHPASVGHGLNLQDGGNTLITYGFMRSYELHEQVIGRIYRQGQTEGKVFVHHIMAMDTIDEDIYQILNMKGNFQENLKNYVANKRGLL